MVTSSSTSERSGIISFPDLIRLADSKARVFAALGFNSGSSPAFIGELRRIAAGGDASDVMETPFGKKYIVPGDLKGPLGELPVVTVWFQERAEERARLVTVRPR